MFKQIGISFALIAFGYGAETIQEKIDKNFKLINYDYNSISEKGNGVNIGFIDSAFAVDHPSFSGKSTETIGSNYLSDYPQKSLQAMHGTHVAAIALGNFINLPNSKAKMYGIASKANLYGASYLNPDYK